MKIYKMTCNDNGVKSIDLTDTKLLEVISDGFYNNGIPYGTKDFGNYHWINSDVDETICDTPFLMGSIPVFSSRLTTQLRPLIEKSDIELLPISIEGNEYNIFHFLRAYNGILNIKKSDISYFKDGSLKDINKYVFNLTAIELPPFFIIEELKTFTFITEEAADIIKEIGISNIVLEKCDIKKESIFSSFWK